MSKLCHWWRSRHTRWAHRYHRLATRRAIRRANDTMLDAHDRIARLADQEGIEPHEMIDALGVLASDAGQTQAWALGMVERHGLAHADALVRLKDRE